MTTAPNADKLLSRRINLQKPSVSRCESDNLSYDGLPRPSIVQHAVQRRPWQAIVQRIDASALLLACAILAGLVGSSVARASDTLRDSATLDGWTTLDGQPVTHGWEVVDGMIHLDISGPRAGHIVTAVEYADFELEFQWKIVAGGNSGIKYRVRDFDGNVLGLEYQIYDDTKLGDQSKSNKSTGAIYDIYAPSPEKLLNPPGQFNHGRIVVRGNRIEHWLNKRLILTAVVGSSEWYQLKAQGKFSDVEGFGENRLGKIMLTDHNSEVWYRNLRIKPLVPPKLAQATCRPHLTRSGRATRRSARRCALWRVFRRR